MNVERIRKKKYNHLHALIFIFNKDVKSNYFITTPCPGLVMIYLKYSYIIKIINIIGEAIFFVSLVF